MHVCDEQAIRGKVRLGKSVEFNRLQMRRNETTAERVQNDPIVNSLGVPQKHSSIEDLDLVALGWSEPEILLRQFKDLWVKLDCFQRCARDCFSKKLIKSTATKADHKHPLGFGMKNRAGSDRHRIRGE